MYAVIKTGGKQHKVRAGDVIEIEYLHGIEDKLTFHPLLVVDDDGHTHVGREAERATVTAKLVGEHKGDKVKVFKYKNKSGSARRSGHRQLMTLIEIEDVSLGQPVKRAAPKKSEEPAEAPDASEEASAQATAEE